MLRNIMANTLTLFCLVDGEWTPFPVEIESTKTVGGLKEAIKIKKTPRFDDIAADELVLWRVSIKDDGDDDLPIVLDFQPEKTKLRATAKLSKVFDTELPEDTIHIIVQRPPSVQTPITVPVGVRARSSTPFSDDSRPSTPLSGDLRADLKKITDKFFAPQSRTANFLDSFVRGKGELPVTTGPIRGLPRAWRRTFGVPPRSRPNLLFMDLPKPSAPDSISRNLASTYILDMVKENNRPLIPVFGVSGCGKTRAALELLSQHWGFYFNASSDDWGSSDMMTLHSTVQMYLKGTRESPSTDRQVNNVFARMTTLLLFLSRLLIFKYCLNVPNSSDTFTSARWTLLQVCPHVFFKDVFNSLFRQLLNLRHHREIDLSDLVRNQFEDIKHYIIKHGGLPKIKEDTRLLVVHDEAQFLGDEFSGDFQSMSSSDESPRPLLSPILHAFRDVGGDDLTLITCGTGLSINTLYWVQSSGSGLKDSSTNFEYIEFPGWTDQESIKAYVTQIQGCLLDQESRKVFLESLPQGAIALMHEKLVGRFRPIAVAIEKTIEGKHGPWELAIKDTEDRLVLWEHRDIKGNLCYELERLDSRCRKHSEKLVNSIDRILLPAFYEYCLFGKAKIFVNQAEPQLVESALGRIKILQGQVYTAVDEPYVTKAVANYLRAVDPYFRKKLMRDMESSSPQNQGMLYEPLMMAYIYEALMAQDLSKWSHQPPVPEMCDGLVGKTEILGWKESGFEHGIKDMNMDDFLNAHIFHQSTWNGKAIPAFLFPKPKPSGPDMVFCIRVDAARVFPVFIQFKLEQNSATFSDVDWEDALSTVSEAKIKRHAGNFSKYCPEKTFISMIVAYPAKWTCDLPVLQKTLNNTSANNDANNDANSNDLKQVVININDSNFRNIFPPALVEFIDRLKDSGKRRIREDDDDDRPKKQKA